MAASQLFTGTVTSNGSTGANATLTTQGVALVINISAISGTLPSFTVKLQQSPEGTYWTDVPNGSGTLTLAGLGTTGTSAVYLQPGQQLMDFNRLVWTVSGLGASVTFDSYLSTGS